MGESYPEFPHGSEFISCTNSETVYLIEEEMRPLEKDLNISCDSLLLSLPSCVPSMDTHEEVVEDTPTGLNNKDILPAFLDVALEKTNPLMSESETEDDPLTGFRSDKELEVLCQLVNLEKEDVDIKYLKKKLYEEKMPFKNCHLCSFKTKRKNHFLKHLRLHSKTNNTYLCSKCDFKAIRRSIVSRHEREHAQELVCKACEFVTSHQIDLRDHILTHHSLQNILMRKRRRKKKVNSNEELQCPECPYRCEDRERLSRHQSCVHSEARPYLCTSCGLRFKRSDTLAQHAAALHAAGLPCPVCGRHCRSPTHLRAHLTVHSDVRPFLCEICGSRFKTAGIHRRHTQTKHSMS